MAIDKINPAAAAGAYATTQKAAGNGGIGVAGPSFGDVMKEAVSHTLETLHAGEKMSAAAVIGKADINDVVQATDQAELALNETMALRDRIIGAYKEIEGMPI